MPRRGHRLLLRQRPPLLEPGEGSSWRHPLELTPEFVRGVMPLHEQVGVVGDVV